MGPVRPGVWKSVGTLADGRDIIYFDEAPDTGRAAVPDTRPLPAERCPGDTPDAGLRWDALRGEWVVIAAQRQDRTFLPPTHECPLDPSRPGRPTEIPAPDYDVVVFENRFPSLRGAGHWPVDAAPELTGPAPQTSPQRAGGVPIYPETGGVAGQPGYGRCEVVCFTSDHVASFASLTPRRARTVVEAWADRTAELGAMDGIAQVYCFENRGEEIGVTLHHPHGQIYGFPFITPRTAMMLAQAGEYAGRTGGNLFDDLLAGEIAAGTRIVTRNEHWTAFVPAAARWPFEVLLFPAQRVPDIPALSDPARDAFCDIYLDVLNRLDALFSMPLPYIAAWHQAPGQDAFARTEFGLHLQVFSIRRAPGKLKYLAGTESGMGVWINDVLPEEAALRLREAG
ncbi:MAG TPA: galactose-1-phosphate uridylyltransferase [Streptosporangiaceae bacterium]|nr:galactose-1-phosphate uridylyltransferase [Streptosporangiaceae bacterium]